MPKLNKEALNNIKYVSLEDYASNVNKCTSLNDKIKFTTRYLLHNDGNKDYSLMETIEFARKTIADAMAKANDYDNLRANMFLSNPIEYIKQEAAALSKELENEDSLTNTEENLKNNCESIANYMNPRDMSNEFDRIKNNKSFDVVTRVENKLGGKTGLLNTLNETKPGFFSRLFNTTSNEWKALDNTFKEFKNPNNNNLYGNKDALSRAAEAYIAHKIPGYKAGDLISDATFKKFDRTSKAKLMFSMNVISSIKEQKELDDNFKKSMTVAENKNVNYDQIIQADKKPKVIDLDQIDFQNKINNETVENDLSNSNQKIIDINESYNEIEDINEIENN